MAIVRNRPVVACATFHDWRDRAYRIFGRSYLPFISPKGIRVVNSWIEKVETRIRSAHRQWWLYKGKPGQMSLFGRLFGIKKPALSEREVFRKAISIDCSGPAFFDVYPTTEDLRSRIARSGLFKDGDLHWIVDLASTNAIQRIVRSGLQLPPDELGRLGLSARLKMGDRFVRAYAGDDLKSAPRILEWIIRVARSHQKHLHDLRRMEQDAGVTHCMFIGGGDGYDPPFVLQIAGKKMTIAAARAIVSEREEELTRCYIKADIKF